MVLLTWAPIFTLIVFAGREVNSKEHRKKQVCEADQNEEWSYTGKNGPRYWKDLFATCNGTHQSPIDIIERNVIPDNSLTAITFSGYSEPMTSAHMVNNGHTVRITQTDDVERSIQDGGLSEVYPFTQFHFHWGSNSHRGSEHLFDGKSYPMEMHVVHEIGEKLAVIAVLFEVSKRDNKDLSPIVDALEQVPYKGDETTLAQPLNLERLIPKKRRRDFYRYEGSLTTPECDEGVTWTVFQTPVKIGEEQLEKFRCKLYSSPQKDKNCRLVDNFRPVQDLNDRTVTMYREPRNDKRRKI